MKRKKEEEKGRGERGEERLLKAFTVNGASLPNSCGVFHVLTAAIIAGAAPGKLDFPASNV